MSAQKIAYTLAEAAEVVPYSIDFLRRATRTTDPNAWPPPLPAKRGKGANAKTTISHRDLEAWFDSLPDAT